MTYRTLMVHLEVGKSNDALLQFTRELAGQLKAGVIGIAAGQPTKLLYTDGYVPPSVISQDIEELEKSVKAAETEFRAAMQGSAATLDWRASATLAPLADFVANEASCADLVITATSSNASIIEAERHARVGDLVMRAGRPILVVPAAPTRPRFERVLVGWKESREARRAIVDALPFLKVAVQVIVAEIAPKDDLIAARAHVDQVLAWLRGHGVTAAASVVASTGDDAAQLDIIAGQNIVDLVVAGAYGHSRLREWVLGGVTRDLLLRGKRCALISH